MPCYATGSYAGDLELSLEEAQRKTTHLTRLLCSTLKSMTDEQREKLPLEVLVWWEQHKEVDAKNETL